MNHTPQIKKAIEFAARKHHGQLRKETGPLPYIIHPFSVALLVAEGGAGDDVVTAALLHDTIEDTGTTREEIVTAFNEHVANLVVAVSEIRERAGKRLPWRERKSAYLANLETAASEAVLIAAADKVDNIESKLESFKRDGHAIHERWVQAPAEYLWFHGEALWIVQARLPEHPLTARLAEVHAQECAILSGS